MEPREYDIMCRAQDTHWWYRGMARITEGIIGQYFTGGQNIRILDAGCGTGAGMEILKPYGTVFGFDISERAIRLCRARGENCLSVASLMALPFEDEAFDLVACFDVLYFEGVDDCRALEEFTRVLVPGGKLFVRVPAFDWLRGIHDLKVSTGHRYTLKELSCKLKQSGLDVKFMSYVNTLLFPLIALKRLSERWTAVQEHSDLTIRLGLLDQVFLYCLSLESIVVRKISLPFGLSLVGLGEKLKK
ncbi:MAG: class I SAM-dependent methyltransferase [Deltaproteobacteria bacterium]|nr:class I SAM-dependent methyltransferase [Deltaproteobacteria bacterium]